MTSQELPAYIVRPDDSASVFAVWPGSGVPPGSEGSTWHEQAMAAPPEMGGGRLVRHVVIPTLTHGFGANTLGRRSDTWRELFRGWLAGHGYLSPGSNDSATPPR